LQEYLHLGNLDAERDWGFAGDYVEAMWRMLQQDKPDDYVIATGRSMSVRAFAEKVFARLDLNAQKHIKVDPRYLRPAEVDHLCGDAGKARRALGWEPRTTTEQLIAMMVEGDMQIAMRERTLRDAGHEPEPRSAQGG